MFVFYDFWVKSSGMPIYVLVLCSQATSHNAQKKIWYKGNESEADAFETNVQSTVLCIALVFNVNILTKLFSYCYLCLP